MNGTPQARVPPSFLPNASFHNLIEALREKEYRILGPTLRNGAVMWDEIRHTTDLRSEHRCCNISETVIEMSIANMQENTFLGKCAR